MSDDFGRGLFRFFAQRNPELFKRLPGLEVMIDFLSKKFECEISPCHSVVFLTRPLDCEGLSA